jgi:hypothetical protein
MSEHSERHRTSQRSSQIVDDTRLSL